MSNVDSKKVKAPLYLVGSDEMLAFIEGNDLESENRGVDVLFPSLSVMYTTETHSSTVTYRRCSI